ncbi:MAG TPA: putative glycolipid-binding domain-containing protein [Candidatus Binataceae bacterium]|nr:putative glycolipid-binding domain-containing protein [Candidatus Binataceae bacterium]
MDRRIIARWQDWSGKGVEHTVVTYSQKSNSADGVVIGASEGEHFAVRYQIRCDGSWTLEHACIQIVGETRKVEFVSDGHGKWTDASGNPLRTLDGAIDIDLSVSPFTNTLPIRRLQLAKGSSAEIRAVYVHFPDLAIASDPQRYTCLEPLRRYRYESLDSDFVREIEVDRDGLVVTYPGLFKRLL